MNKQDLLSSIPKVDEVLKNEKIENLQKKLPRAVVLESIRETLNLLRDRILKLNDDKLSGGLVDIDEIVKDISKSASKKMQPNLKRVINCTGVIVHTNLGRSLLCKDALEAVAETAANYSNLEYDLEIGERGSRYSHLESVIKRIIKAESAIVVNNNAAAVLLVLNTLCKGREAVVSRGELVEIGGSFRVPEIMEQSGAVLKEVGTTNRTHIYDYEKAINENTGVFLKVHTSNYRILGFTESVSSRELASLGGKYNIPVIEDIGSGSFIDFSKYGLSYEPTVQDAISSGIDIVTFSGDKMLGGPQAGIIAGKKKYIDLMKKNPLTRAIRVDKMTIAALEATLMKYIDEETAIKHIPTISMIVESKENLKKRADVLFEMLTPLAKDFAEAEVINEFSQVGGGAMPLEKLPTYAVSIKPKKISVSRMEERLRHYDVPIIVRMQNDRIIIDVRTVREDEYNIICEAIERIFQEDKL